MKTLSTFENVWLQPREKLDGISMMDHLYNRLDGIYPNKFSSNFRDISAIANWKEAWAEAFIDEQVSPNDVALGLKNCSRMFDWPPSLPEFLRACRPHLEPSVAFFEAVRGLNARGRGQEGEWSHPAIFFAAVAVGQFDMLNQGYSQLKTRWEAALANQLALGQWPEVPPVVEALPEPVNTGEAKANAAKVRSMVGASFNEAGDHKRWAKRILADEKSHGFYAVKQAKLAMGVAL